MGGIVVGRGIGGEPAAGFYTALLQDHVRDGRVDYRALRDDERLGRFLAYVAATDPAGLPTREARLAFWINAYNASTLRLVVDHYPLKSINDLATGGRYIAPLIGKTPWDIRFATVGGRRMTLNEIEHETIRKEFDEPRIHFALVCAAVSCPPLRPEAFAAERLDAQLEEQTRAFLADPAMNRFDLATRTATVSRLFDWYARDFGADRVAVLAYVARYAPGVVAAAMRAEPGAWTLKYSDYDWGLNERR